MRRLILNLMPLWLIKFIYRLNPPLVGFKTTTGRHFRLIAIDSDFCIALSSDKYDDKVKEKLVEMQKQGEALVDAAVKGMNMLSFDEREEVMKMRARDNGGKID